MGLKPNDEVVDPAEPNAHPEAAGVVAEVDFGV